MAKKFAEPESSAPVDLLNSPLDLGTTNVSVMDLPPVAGVDPEIDRLRSELARVESERDGLRNDIAQRDAAAQKLPDEGPGQYSVLVRHTPARLKKWEGEAASAQDAWSRYCQAAVKAAYNAKDVNQRAMKQVEAWLREGRTAGFQRTVTKVAA